MIFSILILLLVGVIAFFHYTQGFWSATLSAIATIIAAVLAVSYHESVVDVLLKGKMADQANAFALVALFAIIYLILRIIIDKAIPGNLRMPVILDKVGAGVMGLVAGIFATGVVAIAAQSMPFDPLIAGYARRDMSEERQEGVSVTGKAQLQEVPVPPVIDSVSFDEGKADMFLPVDDWLVGTVAHLSDGGSLSGKRAMKTIHPNYLDELFAQRGGIEAGASRVATNAAKKQVSIDGVFTVPAFAAQADGDLTSSRPDGKPVKYPDQPKDDEMFLIARISFGDGTADKDNLVRFSPGSIRLVAESEDEGWRNYYPIGTVEDASTLFANRIDDYLFTREGAAVDVAFLVKKADVVTGKDEPKFKDGVFIEVKRLARQPLTGGIKPLTADKRVAYVRKPAISKAAPAGAGGAAGGAGAAKGNAPFVIGAAEVSPRMFSAIDSGANDADINNATVASGTVSVQGRKLSKFTINGTEALARMAKSPYALDELFAPAGSAIVQVKGTPPPSGGTGWEWYESAGDFALKDAPGKSYKANGAFAKVRRGTQDVMAAVYDAAAPIAGPVKDEGRPIEGWLAFVVPSGTQLKELTYKGQSIKAVSETVP
ncbi:MAG: CvpA family protein [Tepidisphaeraceae bacterium]